jgi:hypothetical protein
VKDGSFGPTDELGDMDEKLVDAVEGHRFRPLESLFWRNPDLDFRSTAALVKSLEAGPIPRSSSAPWKPTTIARSPPGRGSRHHAKALLRGRDPLALGCRPPCPTSETS